MGQDRNRLAGSLPFILFAEERYGSGCWHSTDSSIVLLASDAHAKEGRVIFIGPRLAGAFSRKRSHKRLLAKRRRIRRSK